MDMGGLRQSQLKCEVSCKRNWDADHRGAKMPVGVSDLAHFSFSCYRIATSTTPKPTLVRVQGTIDNWNSLSPYKIYILSGKNVVLYGRFERIAAAEDFKKATDAADLF